jgi:hypothetical protein
MKLNPRMQSILIFLEENGNICTAKSQLVYNDVHDFYSDMNSIAEYTATSGHPPWIKKVLQPDRTYVYSLNPIGSIMARCLKNLRDERRV